MLKEDQKKARQQTRQLKQQLAEEQSRIDAPEIEKLKTLWGRFGDLRNKAGLTFDDFKRRIDRSYMSVTEKDAAAYEHGVGIKTTSNLPYGYSCDIGGIKCLCAAADALHCSLDYLFGRSDYQQTADELAASTQPIGQTMIAGWMPGGTNPGHSCQCVADFCVEGDKDEKTFRSIFAWNSVLEQWEFRHGEKVEAVPVRWMELPEVDA